MERSVDFSSADLFERCEQSDPGTIDTWPFGLVGMDLAGIVLVYNTIEANLSGLSASRVIGRDFFTAVAPCTNNYMVGHRFMIEPELDATIDYVFTFKMAPTPVRLRLLKRRDAKRMYLAVEKR